MKLALLGKDISHSKSPELYREFISPNITYDLLDFSDSGSLPGLTELSQRYNAINITSPYKEVYVDKVKIYDERVKTLGAINTIVFADDWAVATNTDLLAVEQILKQFQHQYQNPKFVLLGSGVMARLTLLAAKTLNISMEQFCRANGQNMQGLDFSQKTIPQTIIINSCSRKFTFQGKLHPDHVFWDYNYNFLPHQNSLPSQVKSYIDGQEMLRLQAKAAIQFWKSTNPKLKC